MKFGIIGNLSKYELPTVVKLLVETLNQYNIDFVIDKEIAELLSAKDVQLGNVQTRDHDACVRNVVATGQFSPLPGLSAPIALRYSE